MPLLPRLRRPAALLAAALLACLPALPAPAQGLPGGGEVVVAQLLPGWRTAEGTHMAALALTLAPGWKTYWRAPGEAGIPPDFDWSGSSNLASVRLHWPQPEVIEQGSAQSIGYRGRLVLPLEVRPDVAGGTIELRATVELGVCQDVCVPVTLRIESRLDPPGAPDPAIAAALADRPLTAREAGVTALHCGVEPIADGLRLTATVALPRPARFRAAAVETSAAGVWVSEAGLRPAPGGLAVTADLVPEDARPFALDRAGLRLTLIGAGEAVEIAGCPAG
jgi:DsbC/DsbD-like thiol-disulfide interchange protein